MSEHHNWENGSFEKFIRKELENYPSDFDQSAWEAMEKKLDVLGPGENTRRFPWGRIFLLTALLLVSTLIGWYWHSEISNEQEKRGKATLEWNDPVNVFQELNKQANTENASEKNAELLSGSEMSADKSEKMAEKSSKDILQDKEKPAVEEIKEVIEEEEKALNGTYEEEQNEDQAQKWDKEVEDPHFPDLRGRGFIEAEFRELNSAMDSYKPLDPDTVGELNDVEITQEQEQEQEQEQHHNYFSPWNVYLTVAPDFTGTGVEGSRKMGAGAGLLLEYRFHKRFSLLSGVFYSQKNYLADKSFYDKYGSGNYYYDKPDYIDASCGVYDIPLNLRYYAVQNGRHTFFLSGGVSSYLMRSEDYTMVFIDARQDNSTLQVRGENQHLWAVVNFSLGYDFALSNKFAIQLEPFLKIPAKGVGIGAVKLNSAGAFLHLKYRIGLSGFLYN